MKRAPDLPREVECVGEVPDDGDLHVLPGWRERMPWLAQGITGSGADMSLFGRSAAGEVVGRWQALRDRLGCTMVAHARQVHRSHVLVHDDPVAGLVIGPDADGHITRQAGILLGVTVADCVPISIAADKPRAVALLHGGWRGVADGILERGVALLDEICGAGPGTLTIHFGPAICGDCFEVGPEVPAGLGLEDGEITHVDLRAELARRAISLGVPAHRISVSTFCTRHGESPFYSHRGGCAERQVSVLAIRDA